MPTARLKLDRGATDSFWIENGAVPGVITTMSGVFLVEIQGTIQVGKRPLISGDLELSIKDNDDEDDAMEESSLPVGAVERQLGYFDFSKADQDNEVTLVIGKHQRLRGKIVKVNPPMALIELEKGEESDIQRQPTQTSQSQRYQPGHDESAELEIPVLEIITHKIVFDSRPEPVT